MFDYIISLGWFCGTAASMKKYGFRSFSGPFDWLMTPLDSVVYLLESDFEGFLNRNNLIELQPRPEYPTRKEFYDTALGISFQHDLVNGLDKDYEAIAEKYNRRIKKIRKAVNSKTLFIRAIWNQNECDYINKNREMIEEIIKKGNKESRIIYLHPQVLTDTDDFWIYNAKAVPEEKIVNIRKFDLNIYTYKGDEELYNMFDFNKDLTDWIHVNYSLEKVKENKIFSQL